MADQQEECDETDVSLITGALRSNHLFSSEPAESTSSSSLVLRNQMMTVANTNSAGTTVKHMFIVYFVNITVIEHCLVLHYIFLALCFQHLFWQVVAGMA